MNRESNKIKKIFTLLISIFSFLFLVFNFCQAAVLYLLPQSQTVYEGDSFLVSAKLNSEGKEINTAQVEILYSDLFEVVDFNKGQSMFSLWPQGPTIENNTISFVGGTPQGFIGDNTVLNITFRAKEQGKGNINFKENSKVLLNDGKGTEVQLAFLEGTYEIIERPKNLIKISSPSHPDQNKWYSNNSPQIRWDFNEDNEYSYLLSHDPLAVPDEIPDRPEGELMWLGDMGYSNLEDGIYYFHLREKSASVQEWESRVSFRIMIDTKEPEEFTPKIGQDNSVLGGKYFLSFSATDKMSGIDRYEIYEEPPTGTLNTTKEEWKVAESPYVLEDQTLNSVIKVKAVDKADNERIAQITPTKEPVSFLQHWGWKVVGGLLIVGVICLIWRKCRSLKKKTTNNT